MMNARLTPLALTFASLVAMPVAGQIYGPFGTKSGAKYALGTAGRITVVGVHHSPTAIHNLLLTHESNGRTITTRPAGRGRGTEYGEFRIQADEYLSGVRVWYGTSIRGLELRTSTGRTAAFGSQTGSSAEVSRIGCAVVDFRGYADSQIQSLAVGVRAVPAVKTPVYGGTSTTAFQKVAPTDSRIRSLRIYHRSPNPYVLNMGFSYQVRGQTVWSGPFGGTASGGNNTLVTIPTGEYLAKVEIWYRDRFRVEAIRLQTNKRTLQGFGRVSSGLSKVTVGRTGHEIIGFHGFGAQAVDGMGCYLRPVPAAKFTTSGSGCAGSGIATTTKPAGESHNMTSTNASAISPSGLQIATGGFTGPATIQRISMRTRGPGSIRVTVYEADAAFQPLRSAGPTKSIALGATYDTYSVDYPLTLPKGNYVLVHTLVAGSQPLDSNAGNKVWHYHQDRATQQWAGPSFNTAWKFAVVATRTVPNPIPELRGNAPRLGSAQTVKLVGARPNAVAGMMLGFGTTGVSPLTSFGRSDCNLLRTAHTIDTVMTSSAGTATQVYQVPDLSALVGRRVFHQAFVIRSMSPFVLDAVSNIGESTFGY